MSTTKFAAMTKVELRAACKENGVKGYGNMTNDMMRAALELVQPAAPVVPVVETAPVVEAVETTEVETPNVMGSMFGQLGAAPVVKVAPPAVVTRIVEGKKVLVTPETRAVKPAAPAREKSNRVGYTIQKEREQRNGVKAPSEGTICSAIWAYFSGTPSVSSQLNDIADSNGWDRTTVHVQFYVWRKFNGIKGRQASAKGAK